MPSSGGCRFRQHTTKESAVGLLRGQVITVFVQLALRWLRILRGDGHERFSGDAGRWILHLDVDLAHGRGRADRDLQTRRSGPARA